MSSMRALFVFLTLRSQLIPCRPIPDIKVPALPAPYMTYHADGSARASSSKTLSRPSGLQKPKTVAELEVDDRPYEREPSKREKAAVSAHPCIHIRTRFHATSYRPLVSSNGMRGLPPHSSLARRLYRNNGLHYRHREQIRFRR